MAYGITVLPKASTYPDRVVRLRGFFAHSWNTMTLALKVSFTVVLAVLLIVFPTIAGTIAFSFTKDTTEVSTSYTQEQEVPGSSSPIDAVPVYESPIRSGD